MRGVYFLARWPGVIDPGRVTDVMISFVDVLPTLMEAAGGRPLEDLDGRSFLKVLQGKVESHREVICGAHTTRGIISGSVYPIRCVRNRNFRYIRNLYPQGVFQNIITHGRSYDPEAGSALWKSWVRKGKTDAFAASRVTMYQHRPAEEFYDLPSDPSELKNLIESSEYREEIDSLRRQLDQWMETQGDRGLAAERAVPAWKGGGKRKL